jgi:putative ABC transport system permease protein
VSPFEILRVAVSALGAHKLRTFLTLLGVILGVMTVVAVVSVISGLNHYVADSLAILTPDLFIVTKFGIITSREEFLDARKRKDLTIEDYEAIARDCRECAAVGAQYSSQKAATYSNRRLADVQFNGATANIDRLFRFDMDAGRWFTETEYAHAEAVAIIGYDVKDELFPRLDPIGRTIKIEGRPYKVIGLRARQGSILGQSQDNHVNVPLTAYRKQLGGRRSVDVFVKAVSPQRVPLAEDEVRAILRARRSTPFQGKDPFGIVTGEAVMTIYRSITIGLFAVMVLISGISLVVGGIVIANIMLVSVTERTREIGVRMALGARKSQVLLQFLLESALMASAGGAIGILFGSGIAALVSAVTPFPTRVTPFLVAMSLSVAAGVGILAGIVPSIRAANLAPVDALRSE